MLETTNLVSRRTLLAGCAALGILPLAACASGVKAGPELLVAKGVTRSLPVADAPVADVTAGMSAFAHALARANAPKTGNWVVSALSIATAFAMVRVGALGATATSLDRFFGFPASGRDQAFNTILQSLVTDAVPPQTKKDTFHPPIISIGNAVFPSKTLKINDNYLQTLAALYGAGVRPVDFTSAKALAQINAWVKTQTAGRIPVLFDQLDPSTELVLANTVYLKATWLQPFVESPTTALPFTRSDGTTSMAQTMTGGGSYPYASKDGWTALEMPYAGKTIDAAADLSMVLILPPVGGNPVDMLTPAVLTSIGSSLTSVNVDITVPRWDFSTSIDLGGALAKMGLTNVFGTGDFDGIAPGIGGISDAVHKANITVGEYGTEAAAATGIAIAAAGRVPSPLQFKADRPYAFVIVGGPARVPLFTGIVQDPAAS